MNNFSRGIRVVERKDNLIPCAFIQYDLITDSGVCAGWVYAVRKNMCLELLAESSGPYGCEVIPLSTNPFRKIRGPFRKYRAKKVLRKKAEELAESGLQKIIT